MCDVFYWEEVWVDMEKWFDILFAVIADSKWPYLGNLWNLPMTSRSRCAGRTILKGSIYGWSNSAVWIASELDSGSTTNESIFC